MRTGILSIVVNIVCLSCWAGTTNSVAVKLDEEGLRYRIEIRDFKPSVRYDASVFDPPERRALWGAVIFLKTEDGKNVGPTDGWSRSWLQSRFEEQAPVYKPVGDGVISQWFDIAPVIIGLPGVNEKEIETASKVNIRFGLRFWMDGKVTEIGGESGFLPISPELRKELVKTWGQRGQYNPSPAK